MVSPADALALHAIWVNFNSGTFCGEERIGRWIPEHEAVPLGETQVLWYPIGACPPGRDGRDSAPTGRPRRPQWQTSPLFGRRQWNPADYPDAAGATQHA